MDRPDNIILCVADTLSAFHMGFYGYSKETTPFLDSLAEDNFVAEYGYSTAPWTIPSHASLFTGELPNEHKTTSQDIFFDKDTLAARLRKQGYKTVGISNNALISPEIGFDRGFDKFYFGEEVPIEAKNLTALKSILSKDRAGKYSGAFDKYSDFLAQVLKNGDLKSLLYGSKYLKAKVSDQKKPELMEDSGADATNSLIRREALRSDRLFLFLNYMEPHEPYKPPTKFGQEFLEDFEENRNKYLKEVFPQLSINRDIDSDFTEKIVSLYDAEIKYLDSKLEEVWNFLNEELDEFIFIVVGDHGENLGHYGMWDHQFGIWERLVRVPVIIAGSEVPDKKLEEKLSLAEIYGLVEGRKNIEELGEDEVFAEYYGADGFFRNFGGREPEEVETEREDLMTNRSKMVVKGDRGLICNTEIDDFRFRQKYRDYSEETIEDMEDCDLYQAIDEELNTEIEDIDV